MSEPTIATMSATTQQAVLRRHPIRGILWGLMMGIGLSVTLVVTKVISLDLTMMIVVTAIALFVGVLWSTVGPAKAPQGPPPVTVTASAAPSVSRFDDFDSGTPATGGAPELGGNASGSSDDVGGDRD
jgi:hypothetical protein